MLPLVYDELVLFRDSDFTFSIRASVDDVVEDLLGAVVSFSASEKKNGCNIINYSSDVDTSNIVINSYDDTVAITIASDFDTTGYDSLYFQLFIDDVLWLVGRIQIKGGTNGSC